MRDRLRGYINGGGGRRRGVAWVGGLEGGVVPGRRLDFCLEILTKNRRLCWFLRFDKRF